MTEPTWPITFDDVLEAERRLEPHVAATALRRYAPLDAWAGSDVTVWIKHENHNPTNSFKVRNALNAVLKLQDRRPGVGVVAASRGNHGAGLAYAGQLAHVPVCICVPVGNNPEKVIAMRGYGAEVIERGRDYDESVRVAEEVARQRNWEVIHSTNGRDVLAGAATLTLEMLRQNRELDALVVGVGGGSQVVGALTVVRKLRPDLAVYGVQAAAASTIQRAWATGDLTSTGQADTFADGMATREVYPVTFAAMREGLRDFITVSESELVDALRALLSCTHNLSEGAGAAGLAGVKKLAPRLAGKQVGVILSGGNIDLATLRWVLEPSLMASGALAQR
jgi:threonine dehydratase